MKVVQRDTQLITCNTNGDLIGTPEIKASTGVSIDKTKKYILMGFSIIYEYDADFENGSSIEFETRDFFVIDLENKEITMELLFELVKESVDNSYAILSIECGKYSKPAPPRSNLNEIKILSQLRFELDEFYGRL